jgi:hypothetical protein
LVLRGLVLLALPIAAYFAWKVSYYGHLLPNSYYAKAFDGTNGISVGWMKDFLHRYISFVAVAGGLSCLMPAIDWFRRRTSPVSLLRKLPEHLWVIVVIGLTAASAYEYSQAYLLMNYSFRFFMPFYLPIIIVIAHLANHGLGASFSSGGATRRIWIPAAAALFIVIQVCRHMEHLPGEYRAADKYVQLMRDALVPAGKALHDAMPPDEWLAVYIDAGAMPYYSRLRTVDLGGLNDAVIARQKPTGQDLVDYAFTYDPCAWVITSTSPDSIVGREPVGLIVHDPRMQGYTRAAMYSSPARPSYIEVVYVRNDLLSKWDSVGRSSE